MTTRRLADVISCRYYFSPDAPIADGSLLRSAEHRPISPSCNDLAHNVAPTKPRQEQAMSKGLDAKKGEKKKPAKTMKEKKAAKQEKKKNSK
jgi:hypothetical protein